MSLLAPNATEFELALEASVNRPDPPIPIRDLFDPATCELRLLPWLAWALSIENWSVEWTQAAQREAVSSALYVQSIKGTRGSVVSAIESLGGKAYITEWWQHTPPLPPHWFAIAIDLNSPEGVAPTQSYINSVIEEVTRTKPARAHFNFTLRLSSVGGLGLKAVGRPAIFRRLTLTATAP